MTKPTVFLDGCAFENKFQIGIWRIFHEVMARTSHLIDYYLITARPPLQSVPKDVAQILLNRPRRRNVLAYSRYRRRIRLLQKEHPLAIWHSTFYTPPLWNEQRVVTSVYDMIAELRFHSAPNLKAQIDFKAAAITRANRLVCISHDCKTDLARLFPETEATSVVAHLGHEHLTRREPVLPPSDRSSSCLYVGSRTQYKNFRCVLEAIAQPDWPPNLKLHVVGSAFDSHEKALISYYQAEARVQHLGRLSDFELSGQYQQSRYFLFPSLAEGFGIPTLEAQHAGCIPVLNDIRVFREVAGAGAAYFDGNAPSTLARTLMMLEGDRQLQLQYHSEALKNVSGFSWEQTAEAMLQCYLDLHRDHQSS
ncbi:MAG: glycosyltransferase family 4 protein [Planctomycetaceae bacterium]|nr:glycosyltransferase family 4 protein [Planctomycetaceae bacterium]